MLVRFLVSGIADLHWGGAARGDIKDIPDAQAEAFIEHGWCERVEQATPPEPDPEPARPALAGPEIAATVESPERAVLRRPRGR